jgi:GH15 family glucan-1,4-alpha-glucosidase
MPGRIEDYALIGDLQTAALVGQDGSIDWLCFPRFDSGAYFAALLGSPDNGRWLLAPAGAVRACRRRYRPDTLILETTFETDEGMATVIDFMPLRERVPELVRIVVGQRGRIRMRMEFILRFDYGSIVPWVRRVEGGLHAIAGPDALLLRTPMEMHGEDFTTVAEFDVAAGQRVPFDLMWFRSFRAQPAASNAEEALAQTEAWWKKWVGSCCEESVWRETVKRSLITLKALSYAPTGGIVAAATTSLPERLGGMRNWDYRYCWLRDATFTLYALINSGFEEEARAWREWLLRAVAGKPSKLQILYGLAGERRLTEVELPWLSGYQGARPVRIGNAASGQFQLDVYGEVLDAMYLCQRSGLPPEEHAWAIQRVLLDFLESAWKQPDEGIWEVRGPRRNFTHSKAMAWVAFDRAIKTVECTKAEGPVERWRKIRDRIHEEICREGYNRNLGGFVQYYGADSTDASLLIIPLVGFLPASDPRVQGTVRLIERQLLRDGFIARYETRSELDGLPPGEGAFLACTFWYADNLILLGRRDEARRVFERLVGLCNDVGLLSEEYDTRAKRLVGNFPQAFSHVGLVNTARNLSATSGPAHHRQAATINHGK